MEKQGYVIRLEPDGGTLKNKIQKLQKNFWQNEPVTKNYMNTEYIELLKKYNIKRCFYGHLHASSIQDAVEGNIQGIELKLISSDGLNFKLWQI